MSRFENILKQQYLKLESLNFDLPEGDLTEIQKNVVDKLVSSGTATYEGKKKGCAIISYKHDGKEGKINIDPSGKVSSHRDEEDAESAMNPAQSATTNPVQTGTMTRDDLAYFRRFMTPEGQKKIKTAENIVTTAVTKTAQELSKKLASQSAKV